MKAAMIASLLVASTTAAPATSPHALTTPAHVNPVSRGVPAESADKGSFTVYTEAVDIKFGQVRDVTMCPDGCPLPPYVVDRYADGSRQMAVSSWTYDIIRRHADGSETSVPLFEMYIHHATFYVMDGDGYSNAFPLPFTSRREPMSYHEPFRQYIQFAPQHWAVNFRAISTQKPQQPNITLSHLLPQCPCPAQTKFDYAANTINGAAFPSPCSPALAALDNPVCSLKTYTGGSACCDVDKEFVVDTLANCATADCSDAPSDKFFYKATLYYEDVTKHTQLINRDYDGRPIGFPHNAQFGVSAVPTFHMFEAGIYRDAGFAVPVDYTVPKCAAGTASADCAYVLSWIEGLEIQTDNLTDSQFPEREYKLIQTWPHLHSGAVWAKVEDAETNETICSLSTADGTLVYGDGDEIGNENGYLVHIEPCRFTQKSAHTVKAGQKFRMSSGYSAHQELTGAMSGWYYMLMPSYPWYCPNCPGIWAGGAPYAYDDGPQQAASHKALKSPH